MWLGSKYQVEKVTVDDISVPQSPTTTEDAARDLGVMLDSQLTMSAQVSAVCRSAYNIFGWLGGEDVGLATFASLV